MKLWMISQDENSGWDTYDSAVVAAMDKEDAVAIGPNGTTWNGSFWAYENGTECVGVWCSNPDAVTVRLIGEASPWVDAGVIVASFNAG